MNIFPLLLSSFSPFRSCGPPLRAGPGSVRRLAQLAEGQTPPPPLCPPFHRFGVFPFRLRGRISTRRPHLRMRGTARCQSARWAPVAFFRCRLSCRCRNDDGRHRRPQVPANGRAAVVGRPPEAPRPDPGPPGHVSPVRLATRPA